MPDYIASGKSLYAEQSVKVSAASDREAFVQAKSMLPVVWGLERIEENGSLTAITGIRFDSPATPLKPLAEIHEETKWLNRVMHILWQVLLVVVGIVMVILILGCAVYVWFPIKIR